MAFRKRSRGVDEKRIIAELKQLLSSFFVDIQSNMQRLSTLLDPTATTPATDQLSRHERPLVFFFDQFLLSVPEYCAPVCCRATKDQLTFPRSALSGPHVLVPVRFILKAPNGCICDASFVLTKESLLDRDKLELTVQEFCDMLTPDQPVTAMLSAESVQSQLVDIIMGAKEYHMEALGAAVKIHVIEEPFFEREELYRSTTIGQDDTTELLDFRISLHEIDPVVVPKTFCQKHVRMDTARCVLSILFERMDTYRRVSGMKYHLDLGLSQFDWTTIHIPPNTAALPLLLESLCGLDTDKYWGIYPTDCVETLEAAARKSWGTFALNELSYW